MPRDEPRELELKYHLAGKEDYALLLENCRLAPGQPSVRQENYYFDSQKYELARQGGMLRLRFDGKLKLCFKLGGEKDGHPGYFDALEVESSLDPDFLQRALETPQELADLKARPVNALWRHFKPLALVNIGHLVTVRRYRMVDDFLLELDEVTYPDGGVTHEVEIETPFPEEARQALIAMIKKLGIHARPQRRSKLQGLLKHQGVDLWK